MDKAVANVVVMGMEIENDFWLSNPRHCRSTSLIDYVVGDRYLRNSEHSLDPGLS